MAPQRGFHVGGPISRLQLVRYVQAPTLAWPPVRAHPDLSSRAAGPYTPRNGRAVSHSNCGIATCPNRATNMPGLSPGRSWPYRPLHHPEPLTDPDVSLSTYPARVTHERLPPFHRDRRVPPVNPLTLFDHDAGDLLPSLLGRYPVSTLLRSSPPLGDASVLSASWFVHLCLFPFHRQPGSQVPHESPD